MFIRLKNSEVSMNLLLSLSQFICCLVCVLHASNPNKRLFDGSKLQIVNGKLIYLIIYNYFKLLF